MINIFVNDVEGHVLSTNFFNHNTQGGYNIALPPWSPRK